MSPKQHNSPLHKAVPRHIPHTTAGEVPCETQFLLVELAADAYAVLIPLVSGTQRATLRGASADRLALQITSGDVLGGMVNALVVAVSSSPYTAIRRAMQTASSTLGTFELAADKPHPPDVNLFGWCTWCVFHLNGRTNDAFYLHTAALVAP